MNEENMISCSATLFELAIIISYKAQKYKGTEVED